MRSRISAVAPLLALVLLLGLLVTGCARSPGKHAPYSDEPARLAEIASLEASIERDRAALATLVTRPRNVEHEPLHEDPELRALADRLTTNTEHLARLRAGASR